MPPISLKAHQEQQTGIEISHRVGFN